MKLSESIRLGSALSPQAFDSWTPGASCALQAACEALGRPTDEWDELDVLYPWLSLGATCPMKTCEHDFTELEKIAPMSFEDVIWHLNDDHKLAREQIADIVEQWEKQGEHPSVETGVEVGVAL